MKRLVISGIAAALVAGGAGVSFAGGPGGPGPNGHNNFGLCNAYGQGSQNGQDHKHGSAAFKALEAAADDGDSSTTPAQDVMTFCNGVTPGGK